MSDDSECILYKLLLVLSVLDVVPQQVQCILLFLLHQRTHLLIVLRSAVKVLLRKEAFINLTFIPLNNQENKCLNSYMNKAPSVFLYEIMIF